jgi:hypothetical protein
MSFDADKLGRGGRGGPVTPDPLFRNSWTLKRRYESRYSRCTANQSTTTSITTFSRNQP